MKFRKKDYFIAITFFLLYNSINLIPQEDLFKPILIIIIVSVVLGAVVGTITNIIFRKFD